MATAGKDMSVAHLIGPWKGDQSSISMHEFSKQ
jgi:hypothetical protein